MVKYVLTCLLIVAAVSSASAATRMLTLDQAVAIAMEKNRDIAKAGEYARYVEGKYVEERAAALPQLDLHGSTAALRDNGLPQIQGGEVTQYDSTIGLSLTQPLYTWGKIGATIRAAEIGMKTSGEQLRMAQQAARRDVTVTFYNVLLAKELLLVATEDLRQKQRHLEESKKRFDAGVATDYDILAAEVAAENATPAVIRAENLLQMTRERLRFHLALEDAEADAVGSLEPTISAPPDFEEALSAALSRRPELLESGHRIGIYRELVNIAAADNKPRLDLNGGTGWHSLEVDNFRSEGTSWNIAIRLSFPFFDGMRTDGRVAQAESELATKEIETRKLIDSIRLDVRTALNDVREATEILTAISGTVRQAEKLLKMAEKGYEYGVKIRLEVDDAQTNLLKAQINRAKAATDYLVARVNLDWAMGRLGE
jgi:HAE1 family hydrophobic/amphiphilic exporter-1